MLWWKRLRDCVLLLVCWAAVARPDTCCVCSLVGLHQVLARISDQKAKWYTSRGLAKIVSLPGDTVTAVQLLFEPGG